MQISKNELVAVILLVMSTVGVIIGLPVAEKMRRDRSFNVELLARAPENGNWYPRTIEVEMGQEVVLYIRNVETVSHGFALPEFNVGVPEIKAGHVEIFRFTPDRRGTFPFMCTVWCSPRHMEMTGVLVVH